MKKIIIAIGSVVISCSAWAQNNTTTKTDFHSKRGVYIFPEKGEWALGINAHPFLRYVGNVVSNVNGTNGVEHFTYGSNPWDKNAIYGKYMKSENTAYRARFQFGRSSITDHNLVNKSSLSPDPQSPQYITDNHTRKTSDVLLAIGIEKHRGKSRFKGVYGAEIGIGQFSETDEYRYGNPIDVQFNAPEIYDVNLYDGMNRRLTKSTTGNRWIGGLRAFAGIEYFFAPKASIGGEFGYSFMAGGGRNIEETREYWNSGSSSVKEVTTRVNNGGNNGSMVWIDDLGGSINLFIYF